MQMGGGWESIKELGVGTITLFELIPVEMDSIQAEVFGRIGNLEDPELFVGS